MGQEKQERPREPSTYHHVFRKNLSSLAPPPPPTFWRNAEAAVTMERAALLATSVTHEQPNLDLEMLWANLDTVLEGRGGQQ